jgi:hypothetical protein
MKNIILIFALLFSFCTKAQSGFDAWSWKYEKDQKVVLDDSVIVKVVLQTPSRGLTFVEQKDGFTWAVCTNRLKMLPPKNKDKR